MQRPSSLAAPRTSSRRWVRSTAWWTWRCYPPRPVWYRTPKSSASERPPGLFPGQQEIEKGPAATCRTGEHGRSNYRIAPDHRSSQCPVFTRMTKGKTIACLRFKMVRMRARTVACRCRKLERNTGLDTNMNWPHPRDEINNSSPAARRRPGCPPTCVSQRTG